MKRTRRKTQLYRGRPPQPGAPGLGIAVGRPLKAALIAEAAALAVPLGVYAERVLAGLSQGERLALADGGRRSDAAAELVA